VTKGSKIAITTRKAIVVVIAFATMEKIKF
jgi:hypothetical protein